MAPKADPPKTAARAATAMRSMLALVRTIATRNMATTLMPPIQAPFTAASMTFGSKCDLSAAIGFQCSFIGWLDATTIGRTATEGDVAFRQTRDVLFVHFAQRPELGSSIPLAWQTTSPPTHERASMRSFLDHPSHGLASRPTVPVAAEKLSSDQVDELAAMLGGLLDEHRRRLADNEDLFRTLTDDSSVDADERRSARLRAEQEFDAIQATKMALAALEDGVYGLCVVCGRSIPFERLEMLPRTRTCVVCPEPS